MHYTSTIAAKPGRAGLRRLGGAMLLAMLLALAGCVSVGPGRLAHDQVDYARALADAKKRQTLANIVGLRFADAPAFLATSQIIAAYQFDATGNATLSGSPVRGEHAYGDVGGSVAYSDHPTFTFAPVTGNEYAITYIRPLAPSLIMPLAESGAPIDVLLRLAVQSIGSLHNSGDLGGQQSDGTEGFFTLIHALRRLQITGALSVQYTGDNGGHVFLQLDPDAALDRTEAERDAATVRRLLGLSGGVQTYEMVYGQSRGDGRRIGLMTRSVLGILGGLGAQIEVPDEDVRTHVTAPTVHFSSVEPRPTIIVHVGKTLPANAYVGTFYDGNAYWIERDDFDSKFAFNVLQNIMSLAESSQNQQAPLVTIPAG